MTNLVTSLPAPGEAQSIGWWLLCLFAILGGTNQLFRLADRLKPKPEPSEAYVGKEVCRATMDGQAARISRLEEDVRGIKDELRGMRKDFADGLQRISAEAEARASRLHKRIDPILEKLGPHDRSTD